jgi:ACS family D-galactonate transporter-like MFS transporter
VIVGLLFLAGLFNYLDRVTLSVALPVISLDLSIGPASKGLLLSAFFWSYASMQLPVGWCVDHLSLRWFYPCMFAAWSLACGMTGLAGSLGMMVLLRVMLGVGESIYLPAATKIVSNLYAQKERGLPSGIFNSGARAGLALGTPVVGLLIVHLGWRRMFLAVSLLGLVWIVPWLLLYPKRLPSSEESAGEKFPGHRRGQRMFVSVNRNLLGICLGFFCFDYYGYLLITWLPDYLVEVRHMTILNAGIYTSIPFLIFGLSEPLGGWVADSLIRRGWDETRTRKGAVIGPFLAGILIVPAVNAGTVTGAVLFICGACLSGSATGNLTAILQSCAPAHEVGRWTGVENLAGNMGGIIAPVVMGLLILRTGSFIPGFVVAALVILIGAASYGWVVGKLEPPLCDELLDAERTVAI